MTLVDDEEYVISLKGQFDDLHKLLKELSVYFSKKYGFIEISHVEVSGEFLVKCGKHEKRVAYLESIPKAVQDILG